MDKHIGAYLLYLSNFDSLAGLKWVYDLKNIPNLWDTGETYCIAHHVSASEGKRTLFIASLRYYDVFAKVEGKWLFAERKLMVGRTLAP